MRNMYNIKKSGDWLKDPISIFGKSDQHDGVGAQRLLYVVILLHD